MRKVTKVSTRQPPRTPGDCTTIFLVTSAHRVSLKVHVDFSSEPGELVIKKLLFAIVALAALSTAAPAKELLNLENGVAVQGYDPVAFFSDHRPVKGSPQFQSQYRGAKYYFASAEHKTTFDKEPGKYEPQFGGFCAYGVSRGKTVPVKIETWEVLNGRLLLQYDLDVKSKFDADPQGTLKKADENWPGLVDKHGK
jgi:YHS domain-containing protein